MCPPRLLSQTMDFLEQRGHLFRRVAIADEAIGQRRDTLQGRRGTAAEVDRHRPLRRGRDLERREVKERATVANHAARPQLAHDRNHFAGALTATLEGYV